MPHLIFTFFLLPVVGAGRWGRAHEGMEYRSRGCIMTVKNVFQALKYRITWDFTNCGNRGQTFVRSSAQTASYNVM